MDKNLTQIESWLSEYLILEKRIDSLYTQSQRPQLRDMFLRMGPKGDQNMAVDTEGVRVDGGHRPIPWAVNLETVYSKLKEISEDISQKIMACVAHQTDIRCAVDNAGLTQEEYLYIEQRYFLGMTVKEMEREGCGETKLRQIKLSALQKIYGVRADTKKYMEG